MTRIRHALRGAATTAALLAVSCASTARLPAVPARLAPRADVVGFTNDIRYFPRDAEDVRQFEEAFVASWGRERATLGLAPGAPLPPAAYLAISGGGDNGAFGAGLLNGWTKAGDRPTFKLVTGVSTGALIAPFAFLGPAYDARLKALYTDISMKDIAELRPLYTALFSEAMADTAPLARLVEKSVTQEMLDAIAAEHEKGRILLVGTTNLDARRPVIWDITRIAATHSPSALRLVHKILLASAAIPGTFPPVMIDVTADGRPYSEMHVDGGTANQVFVYPVASELARLSRENDAERARTLYIIRNARLDPEWAQVDRRTLPIALRAITCLIQYQGIGDLYRIYTIARRDHVAYNLAYIPPTFDTPHTTDFDQPYMRALFDLGDKMAAERHEWATHPPVLLSGEGDENAKLLRLDPDARAQ
ncbi:MAG TPA: patatin-like phospholipase family protein [Thermoanaerobaculia bacterium]|jgi:predicted acylesterase/phospholipase RssA|nr:patatin-like phospholipase family protein [Thermoanaerobaculia bacterium]